MSHLTPSGAFGATLLAPDRTRFRLWAPGAHPDDVAVEVLGMAPQPMQALPEGWYEAQVACGAGARYRFRVAPDLAVPDPASRWQAGDVHGHSVVVDPHAYAWRTDWRGRPWHETVLYEAHVGLAGGYAALARRIPALAHLGITALELMPVADFPGTRNWGYDGVLPFAPDTAYGTPDELRALVDTAHAHGMMVFLDVVYNHFGPDGNYLNAYADAFFRDDIPTPWGPAIDVRCPQVCQFFTENARYWLTEFRMDGLRLDAVHAFPDGDWLTTLARELRASVAPGRYIHLVLENDHNQARYLPGAYDAQWNDDAHHVLHVLLTGEQHGYYADYAQAPAQRLARSLAQGFVYQGEPSMRQGGQARGEPSGHLSPTAFVLFLQNHDQIGNRAFGERLTTLMASQPLGAQRLRAAVALQLLAPHIPLMFMGEEFESQRPFLYFTDHNDTLARAIRDGRRREFSHDETALRPDGPQTLPDPNDPATYAACGPVDMPERKAAPAPETHYRRLLALRHTMIVPRLPGTRALGAQALGSTSVCARWTMGDGQVLVLFSNLGADDQPLPAPALTHHALLFDFPAGAYQSLAQGLLPAGSTVALLQASPSLASPAS